MAKNKKKIKKLPKTDIFEDQADALEQEILDALEACQEESQPPFTGDIVNSLKAMKVPVAVVRGIVEQIKYVADEMDSIGWMNKFRDAINRDSLETVLSAYKSLDEYLNRAFKVTCRRPSRTWTWHVG